jgi:hypothetical protein
MRGMRALVVVLTVLIFLSGLEWTGSGVRAGSAEGATSANPGNGDAIGSRLHDGAKGFGDSLLGGIKFVGRTIISPFTGTTGKVSRDADTTGKRLHQGAKGFGDGLYGGLKYAGRKVGSFFSESDTKAGR